jgi:hypothetical protein
LDRVLEIETAAIEEFHAQAVLHLPTNILSRTTDFTGWLTIMQHYRAPTRLLDWSASPYVAAYFAIAQGWGPRGSDGVIWYFSGGDLSRVMTALGWSPQLEHPPGINSDEHLSKIFKIPSPPLGLILMQRREREERMVAQQGVFTISPDPLADHAQVIETAGAGRTPGWFGCIVIPKEQKPGFLHQLRFMNISANALFPGIDGIGQSVEELVRLFPPPPATPPPGTSVVTTATP